MPRPSKAIKAKQTQLSEARALSAARDSSLLNLSDSSVTLEELQTLLATSEEKVQLAEIEVAKIKLTLESEREESRRLREALKQEIAASAELAHVLILEKEHSAKLYKALRVEKRARQRGQARKKTLEDQIKLLQLSAMSQSDKLKGIQRNASKAIDTLLKMEKENSNLSKSLEQCRDAMKQTQIKVQSAGQKLKESRTFVARLQKRCVRAVAVKENAVQQAKEKIIKDRSIHTLLKKGVYTEETRNLIHLLVQAGCSREYVGKVIHAIFRTAGISVVGSVSRRTVSRIVVEGYYAAQIQLGYEMQNTNGMFCVYNFYDILIWIY